MIKLNFWTIGTIAFLLLFLWSLRCGHGNGKETVKIEYKTIHDSFTVDKPGPVQIIEHTPPTKVIDRIVTVPVNVAGQTIYKTDTIYKPLDSAEVVRDYYVERTYSQDFPIDTVGITGNDRVGVKVSENKAAAITLVRSLTIPEKTVTKQKGQVYIGGDIYGNQNIYLKGAGANLQYKTAGSKIYRIGILKLDQVPIQYNVGFSTVISFKK